MDINEKSYEELLLGKQMCDCKFCADIIKKTKDRKDMLADE